MRESEIDTEILSFDGLEPVLILRKLICVEAILLL